jgi:5-methyltetrahydropteroyltriglutamate--homocysteine methyltransferase
VRVIQIDEPGLREGLPLQAAERNTYLAWATRAFQLAVAPAGEATQIHTHMCYADFSDVVDALGELDVDVISLEAARSGMAAIRVLTQSCYAGGVGPGIYDVHSPLVPSIDELAALLRYAVGALGADRVWANPDCGLKTRSYDEVVPALRHLVAAARRVRDEE